MDSSADKKPTKSAKRLEICECCGHLRTGQPQASVEAEVCPACKERVYFMPAGYVARVRYGLRAIKAEHKRRLLEYSEEQLYGAAHSQRMLNYVVLLALIVWISGTVISVIAARMPKAPDDLRMLFVMASLIMLGICVWFVVASERLRSAVRFPSTVGLWLIFGACMALLMLAICLPLMLGTLHSRAASDGGDWGLLLIGIVVLTGASLLWSIAIASFITALLAGRRLAAALRYRGISVGFFGARGAKYRELVARVRAARLAKRREQEEARRKRVEAWRKKQAQQAQQQPGSGRKRPGGQSVIHEIVEGAKPVWGPPHNKVLIIGICIAVLMGLFPPWRVKGERRSRHYSRYGFVFSPPVNSTYENAQIDGARLLIQWFITSAVAAGLYFALRLSAKQKSEQPTEKSAAHSQAKDAAPALRFCPACGKELNRVNQGQPFCPFCGEKVLS